METTPEPLRSPLDERHRDLGGRMVAFAGWTLPLFYPPGILAEHRHTRTAASLFDTSHMGEIRVAGGTAAEALDRALARPVSSQAEGACRYNLLLSEEGGILDDLVVYRMGAEDFWIVTNAATRTRDLETFYERLPRSVTVDDRTDDTGKLDLQGPASARVLSALGLLPETLPSYYRFSRHSIEGREVLLSRTGYTGELGYEFYSSRDATGPLWDRLLELPELKPAGLGARDTLRLEAGLPLYGRDMTAEHTPAEAGLEGSIRREEGFAGDAFRRRPVTRRRVGLRLSGRQAGRTGDAIEDASGARVGTVTSGAFGPSLGHAVAMGYLDASASAAPGVPYSVRTGSRVLEATVVALPFYRDGTARIDLTKGESL